MRFHYFKLLITLNSIFIFSCESSSKTNTLINWDTYGVPHIVSSTKKDLFFAQGWALMHNHANKVLQLYGKSRGRASEYWGKKYIKNDILVHTLGFSELADQWVPKQDPELKMIYTNFVKGMNAYLQNNLDQINEENKVVLPLTTKDVNMHGMFVVFTRFIGGSDLGRVQQWPDMGSNTYAISPKKSASGNAMLVQNPHLPWSNEFLFTEYHFNLNGRNLYGANLLGMPGIAIGFNESLGWSHTDNTIDNTDTYELKLIDDGYELDGKKEKFESSSKILLIKQDDGSLKEKEIKILKTRHGPVIKKTKNNVLAIRLVGLDRANMFLQWWKMLNSKNFDEFETALKMAQIPFWNVMYADKLGQIFYVFNGLVPKRKQNSWEYWDRIIPGGKSEDIWTEVHAYDDLPKIKNPEIGWLQNANDPPWSSTIPMVLNPDDYPGYMAPKVMHFRPQRSAKMLIEDSLITFDELVDYKLSTRLEFADRILDNLFEAIDIYGSDKARNAKNILQNWGRDADADSKGTLLFYTWSSKFNIDDNSIYSTPWDINDPINTPDGLSNPKEAVKYFEEAINEIEAQFGKLDIPWGDYYRINYNGIDLPANGIDGRLGVFRVAWPGRSDSTNMYVGGGDSWVAVIEFGDKVKAKALLSYGNSTEKDSPNNGDQLKLFSKKELRDIWFYDIDIIPNVIKKEKKIGNMFKVYN
jgi:acyl-homoserine-lactone acylase|tara:strand:+ start:5775 stop:7865 length:2091 start_codon:yes stop_codon:yes gene_type:complete